MNYEVEFMKASDWTKVAEIYTEGIMTKIATFQSEAPSWEEWNKGHCESCRLVAYLPFPVGVFMLELQR